MSASFQRSLKTEIRVLPAFLIGGMHTLLAAQPRLPLLVLLKLSKPLQHGGDVLPSRAHPGEPAVRPLVFRLRCWVRRYGLKPPQGFDVPIQARHEALWLGDAVAGHQRETVVAGIIERSG